MRSNRLLKRIIGFLFPVLFLVRPSLLYAYRPFESTDADVAGKGEWEIELGAFHFSHDEENELIAPSVRINYGFARHWELVMESDLQIYKEGKARNAEIRDPAVFLKGILREGVLQEKEGLSLAGEFGVLLPETVREERNAGLEGIGIAARDGALWLVPHRDSPQKAKGTSKGCPQAVEFVRLQKPH